VNPLSVKTTLVAKSMNIAPEGLLANRFDVKVEEESERAPPEECSTPKFSLFSKVFPVRVNPVMVETEPKLMPSTILFKNRELLIVNPDSEDAEDWRPLAVLKANSVLLMNDVPKDPKVGTRSSPDPPQPEPIPPNTEFVRVKLVIPDTGLMNMHDV